jgi:hypothetical protein
MADHMRTELVTRRAADGVWRRRPDPGLIWHSDQGRSVGCPSSVSDSDTTRYEQCENSGTAVPFRAFSLGATFEDLPAVAALRRCDDPYVNEAVHANYVSYIYGDCEINPQLDDDRCTPPLEIQSWPACERSFADYTFNEVATLFTGL